MQKTFYIILLIICNACAVTNNTYTRASLWEAEIKTLEAKDKTQQDPENAILFIGSSSIRLWKNIEKDMAPYPVIQRGFGGANFTDLIYFSERIVYPHNFKAVVIFVANDIVGGENDKSPREVLELFKTEEMIIRKKYNSQPIYFIGITPCKSRWSVWQNQKQANMLIEAYCKNKTNLHFIATEASYLDDNKEPIQEYFLSDNLHQNQKGYDVWSSIIKEKLNETLK
jgi:hypothetical protein